jgi:hypothetical protein
MAELMPPGAVVITEKPAPPVFRLKSGGVSVRPSATWRFFAATHWPSAEDDPDYNHELRAIEIKTPMLLCALKTVELDDLFGIVFVVGKRCYYLKGPDAAATRAAFDELDGWMRA